MTKIDKIISDIKGIVAVLDPKGAAWAEAEKKRRELSTGRLTTLGEEK
jgi:hypothetical protein